MTGARMGECWPMHRIVQCCTMVLDAAAGHLVGLCTNACACSPERLLRFAAQQQDCTTAASGLDRHCCRWNVPELAEHFRIRQQRVMAILALKEMEHEEVR